MNTCCCFIIFYLIRSGVPLFILGCYLCSFLPLHIYLLSFKFFPSGFSWGWFSVDFTCGAFYRSFGIVNQFKTFQVYLMQTYIDYVIRLSVFYILYNKFLNNTVSDRSSFLCVWINQCAHLNVFSFSLFDSFTYIISEEFIRLIESSVWYFVSFHFLSWCRFSQFSTRSAR